MELFWIHLPSLMSFPPQLLQLNIRWVLSITTHEIQSFDDSHIRQKQIKIKDGGSTTLLEYLDDCWAFIDAGLGADSAVLVQDEVGMYVLLVFFSKWKHLLTGANNIFSRRSRSGAVVVSYLMKRERMSLRDAFNLVKIRRPIITPAFAFVRQLRELECALDPREEYNRMHFLVDYLRDFYYLRRTFSDQLISDALEQAGNDPDKALMLLFEAKIGKKKRALRPPTVAEG